MRPTGWLDHAIKYEHLFCFPLSVMMHVVHIVRFMLIEAKYAYHPKWLDATGNSAVDQRACEAYRRILQMLRLRMQHVHVHDVFLVLNRGRWVDSHQEQFNSRLQGFDTMSLKRMKELNRAARSVMQRREGEEMAEREDMELDTAHFQLSIWLS